MYMLKSFWQNYLKIFIFYFFEMVRNDSYNRRQNSIYYGKSLEKEDSLKQKNSYLLEISVKFR